jgi:hypothetical protein
MTNAMTPIARFSKHINDLMSSGVATINNFEANSLYFKYLYASEQNKRMEYLNKGYKEIIRQPLVELGSLRNLLNDSRNLNLINNNLMENIFNPLNIISASGMNNLGITSPENGNFSNCLTNFAMNAGLTTPMGTLRVMTPYSDHYGLNLVPNANVNMNTQRAPSFSDYCAPLLKPKSRL